MHFGQGFLFKDYVLTAYLSDRLFLAIGHILLKISSKISSVATKKSCPPWIKKIRVLRVLRGLFRVPTV